MLQKIRLNKYIASCGLGSRRAADDIIKSGFVEINGQKVDNPATSITEKDIVKVKGKIITPEKKEYIIFYKPAGYITTTNDEKGRKTIYEFLPEGLKNLKPAGRLDKDSTGLLIMTNDGELIQKLTHPKKMIPRVYRVMAEGKINEQDLIKFKKGIEIEKGKIAYAEAKILEYKNSVTTLEMVLFQGYNRQIRRMLEDVEHPVLALKRFSHACIELGSLNKGKYRYLIKKEIQDLYNYLG
ncbi:MAG TPA: pseudouridine synthase [Candidatus Gastranaerophilales bacterium]|nr:pseudouridine synthase [Candidatus Gastranaerophilales bacterium]